MKYRDIHLHLDGSLPPAAVRKLAEMNHIPVPADQAALSAFLTVSPDCRDLNTYLEKFEFPLSLLQTTASLEFAVSELVKRLAELSVEYAEIRFAPQYHTRKGLSQIEACQAVFRGYRRVRDLSGMPVIRFIFCLMRQDYRDPVQGLRYRDANQETVDVGYYMMKKEPSLFAGLDLAGAEALYPTTWFESEFSTARKYRIPFTIHAGEAAGPESIRAALDFGARRIGHGIAAARDEVLMDRLAREGIVLELCPTSNLQTKAVPSMAAYPLRTFLEHGIRCTINTDNMTVSGTTLQKEFALLRQGFGRDMQPLTDGEMENLMR